MRALEAALNEIWAMEEGALSTLLAIAARENVVTPEAIAAYEAKALANTERATVRDGVAIFDINGALFKRANLFTSVSGATSYDIVRKDFQAALDDPSVKAILFNIDSPGGAASGAAELSTAIYDARGKKPLAAYVNGTAASAAYNIASAVDPGRLVVAADALLGSLGVQMAIREDAPKAGEKAYTFISSQSPLKNADPGTEAGAKSIQSTVDAMAQVFVETVARNRGTDTETVLKDFGKGGIFVGKDAVKAGLADTLGSFESVLAELSGKASAAGGGKSHRSKGTFMSETTAPAAETKPEVVDIAAAVAKAVGEAQAAERTRISGLNRLASAHGVAAADLNAAVDTGSTIEAFALKIADGETAKRAAKIDALKSDETVAAVATPSTGAEATGEKTAEDVANEIIASADLAAGKAK